MADNHQPDSQRARDKDTGKTKKEGTNKGSKKSQQNQKNK